MKVSILVSDVDSQGKILLTVNSLLNQNYPKNSHEIILQDLGRYTKEEQKSLKEFEKQYPHFKLISHKGKNRSQITNEAARKSKGELLLFIESHCIAPPNWIQNYVKLFKNKKIQAAIGHLQTIPNDSLIGKSQDYLFWKVRKKIQTNFTSGFQFDVHNAAIRRSCFTRMGGINEKLPYGGEFELGARLHKNNMRVATAENPILHFNLNTLPNYFRVISGQGMDRTRILMMHDKEFTQKYFNSPSFFSKLPYLKKFRPFLLGAVILLICTARVGILTAELLNLPKASRFFFQQFAENSRRYGIIKALKNN